MRAFRKDFIREITKNKGRFLSVFFIVLLGAAFFSGIRSAEGDMKVSADRYYDEVNYMDLKVLGTLGLTDDDLADIAKTDGVKAVYGGKTVEVLHDIGESEQVVKLIALTDGVNEPRVVEGRMPEKEDEILVDTQFLKSSGCEIGDQVTFTSGTEDPLSDSLTGDTFTIVGSATLPYYMDLNRGTGSIGNGSINSFALLLPETFTSDLYTEIYVQADGAQEEASYSDAYDETVKAVQTKIEALEDAACDRRYTAVKTEGQEKIDDAKQQVADAEQKLADAKTELDDGAQQLADAKVTIADKEQELLDGEQTLKDKEQELLDGKQTIAEKEQELLDGKQGDGVRIIGFELHDAGIRARVHKTPFNTHVPAHAAAQQQGCSRQRGDQGNQVRHDVAVHVRGFQLHHGHVQNDAALRGTGNQFPVDFAAGLSVLFFQDSGDVLLEFRSELFRQRRGFLRELCLDVIDIDGRYVHVQFWGAPNGLFRGIVPYPFKAALPGIRVQGMGDQG